MNLLCFCIVQGSCIITIWAPASNSCWRAIYFFGLPFPTFTRRNRKVLVFLVLRFRLGSLLIKLALFLAGQRRLLQPSPFVSYLLMQLENHGYLALVLSVALLAFVVRWPRFVSEVGPCNLILLTRVVLYNLNTSGSKLHTQSIRGISCIFYSVEP